MSKPQEEVLSSVREHAFEPPEEKLSSRLQETILRIVCTRQNVDYALLMKETNRDRVTVAQSVNSLVYEHYVSKDKINPEYEKSKVFIKPTFLGKHFCVNFLKVNLEDILKAEDNEHISAFLEFIKDIHPYQREKLIKPLNELYFVLHASSGLLINNMPTDKDETIKDELKRALKMGISELVQDEDYDAEKLLNERSIESLKKAFSSSDIKELRQSVIQLKKNIIATADRFPE